MVQAITNKRKGGLGLLLAVSMIFLCRLVWAGDEVQNGSVWLNRIARAVATETYSGEVQYYRIHSTPVILNVTHTADSRIRYQPHQVAPSRSFDLMWDKDQPVLYLTDESGNVRHVKLPPLLGAKQISGAQVDQLLQYYTLKILGKKKVAGRSADMVALVPKAEDRYEYRGWVDTETGILLGGARLNEQGVITESFFFRTFQKGPTGTSGAESSSRPSHGTSETTDPLSFSSSQGLETEWSIGYLPKGFVEVAQLNRRFGKGGEGKQWVFCDGLNTLSIFFRKRETPASEGVRVSQPGAESVAATHKDGYEIVVIGEIPLHTAVQVINSLRKRPL